MTEAAEPEVPVLVVGAGPACLMTSLLLSRYGVASLLVERHAEVSVLPRAMGVNARTMEIFRGLGLAADVEAIAVDVGDCPFQVELETLRGPLLGTVPRGGASHAGGPGSPTPGRFVFCAQNRLEPMLQGQLTASGMCQVRRGIEFGRLRDEHCDPDGPQPGLEAGCGAARLGGARTARQLRDRAPSLDHTDH